MTTTKANLELFHKHLLKRLSETSARTYTRAVRAALADDADEPWRLLLKPSLAPSSRHTYLAALRRWAEFTEDDELLSTLQGEEMKRTFKNLLRESHRRTTTKEVQPLSLEEERAIVRTLDAWRRDSDNPAWLWPALSMMFTLGLRAGVDLAYLTKKDVDNAIKNGVELVIVTKGAKERRLPAVLVLEELRALSAIEPSWDVLAAAVVRDTDYRGDSDRELIAAAYERIRLATKRLATEAGLDADEVHPHRFRHSAAQRLYAATKDIKKVQEFLGHESINTTLGYLKKHRTAEIGDDLSAVMRQLREEV